MMVASFHDSGNLLVFQMSLRAVSRLKSSDVVVWEIHNEFHLSQLLCCGIFGWLLLALAM